MVDDGNAMGSEGQIHWISGSGKSIPEAAKYLMNVVTRPDFTDSHIEFYRQEVRAMTANWPSDVTAIQAMVFCKVVLGKLNPYCSSRLTPDAELPKLTHDRLVETHNKLFSPSRATIVAVGDFDTTALRNAINDAYRIPIASPAPKPKNAPQKPSPKAKTTQAAALTISPSSARIVVVDRPGSKQARVSYGLAAPAHPFHERAATAVMNQLLVEGGMGSIRRALREELVVNWPSSVNAQWGRSATILRWDGAVESNTVGPVIRELSRLLRRELSGPLAPADLEAAKNRAASSYASSFETPFATVERIRQFIELEIPLTELADETNRISAVTADQVKEAIRTWFDPDQTRIVIVGDWKSLRGSLSRLDMGPIEIRDNNGDIVRVENLARPGN